MENLSNRIEDLAEKLKIVSDVDLSEIEKTLFEKINEINHILDSVESLVHNCDISKEKLANYINENKVQNEICNRVFLYYWLQKFTQLEMPKIKNC